MPPLSARANPPGGGDGATAGALKSRSGSIYDSRRGFEPCPAWASSSHVTVTTRLIDPDRRHGPRNVYADSETLPDANRDLRCRDPSPPRFTFASKKLLTGANHPGQKEDAASSESFVAASPFVSAVLATRINRSPIRSLGKLETPAQTVGLGCGECQDSDRCLSHALRLAKCCSGAQPGSATPGHSRRRWHWQAIRVGTGPRGKFGCT